MGLLDEEIDKYRADYQKDTEDFWINQASRMRKDKINNLVCVRSAESTQQVKNYLENYV